MGVMGLGLLAQIWDMGYGFMRVCRTAILCKKSYSGELLVCEAGLYRPLCSGLDRSAPPAIRCLLTGRKVSGRWFHYRLEDAFPKIVRPRVETLKG
jgi:hypothetical protein